MTGALPLCAFLVTLNNPADHESDLVLVQHILAMDSSFPDGTDGDVAPAGRSRP